MSASDLVERGLDLAAATPHHLSTSVIVHDDSTVNLRWACNTLTTNGMSQSRSVTVAIAVRTSAGTSLGSLTRHGVTTENLADLVNDAAASAAAGPAAEDAADLPPAAEDADFAESATGTGPQVLDEVSIGLGDALREARADERELFGFAEHSIRTTWLGTSTGSRRRHVQPKGTLEVTGKSHQRTRSVFDCRYTSDFADIDVGEVVAGLRTRLGWQARREELPPGRYDTILPGGSLADLLVYLYFTGDARAAAEGRSVFSRRDGTDGTRIGERLSETPLTLRSDPSYPGLRCRPFVATGTSSPFESVFDNGMDIPAATWIEDGVLSALPSTRHTATLADTPLAPPPDNLVLEAGPGAGSLEDLVAQTGDGLLVTSLWYLREVDPVTLLMTGLTRDGVYRVQGGEVTGAVNNFRFNESPLDVLARLDAIGETRITLNREWNEFFSRTAIPPVRVRDFNMSSTSQGT